MRLEMHLRAGGRVSALDGRNRWLAMTQFSVPPLEPRFEAVTPTSPIAYVISMNEKRRHMNESQRSLTSARALAFYEAEAKARKVAAGKAGVSQTFNARKNRLRTARRHACS